MYGSGCWTPGQKVCSAECRTEIWRLPMPRQTPCGRATGTSWEEPGLNHLSQTEMDGDLGLILRDTCWGVLSEIFLVQ